MKVIDLLNKIANGEEVPRIIKYGTSIYKLEGSAYKYNYVNEYNDLLENVIILENLNDEIEIIEEDKKIEKIYELNNESDEFKVLRQKINEIIDKLNAGVDKE